jgi:hypothetical protein
MNLLSNNALQQLDEAGLYSPIDQVRTAVTQAAIDAGVKEARLLRSQAFHRAAYKIMTFFKGRTHRAD